MSLIAGASVLIVDDDPGTCETFGHVLRGLNIQVVTALAGRDALRSTALYRFDFAIVDLRLGDMWGTALVRTWHSAGIIIPFVLIAGLATTGDTVDAMRLGANRRPRQAGRPRPHRKHRCFSTQIDSRATLAGASSNAVRVVASAIGS